MTARSKRAVRSCKTIEISTYEEMFLTSETTVESLFSATASAPWYSPARGSEAAEEKKSTAGVVHAHRGHSLPAGQMGSGVSVSNCLPIKFRDRRAWYDTVGLPDLAQPAACSPEPPLARWQLGMRNLRCSIAEIGLCIGSCWCMCVGVMAH